MHQELASEPIFLFIRRTQKKLQVRLHGPQEPGSKTLPMLRSTTCSDGCLDYLPQAAQLALRRMQMPKNEGDEIKRTVRSSQPELWQLTDLAVWDRAERDFQEKGPSETPMPASAIADTGRPKPQWLKKPARDDAKVDLPAEPAEQAA